MGMRMSSGMSSGMGSAAELEHVERHGPPLEDGDALCKGSAQLPCSTIAWENDFESEAPAARRPVEGIRPTPLQHDRLG
eukprot:3502720-Pyramimonas_sp.AAC.1